MKKERFQQSALESLGNFIAENMVIKVEIRNPTGEEKSQLMQETGKDASQISQWFARQKRKLSTDKIKAWCMHEIGLQNQGVPPPTTVSSMLVGKKRRKTAPANHPSKRAGPSTTNDNSPFDHLQLRVLRNARLNNIGASEQALKVITTCARLSQRRLQNWWNKFPTSKLSPELRQQSETELLNRAVQVMQQEGVNAAAVHSPKHARLLWILEQSFRAIGSEPQRIATIMHAMHNRGYPVELNHSSYQSGYISR